MHRQAAGLVQNQRIGSRICGIMVRQEACRVAHRLDEGVVLVQRAAILGDAERQQQQGNQQQGEFHRDGAAHCPSVRSLVGTGEYPSVLLLHGNHHRTRTGTSGPPLAGPPGTPEVAQGLSGSSDRPKYSRYIRSAPVPLPPMLLLMGCSISTQAQDWTGATVDPDRQS